MKKGTKDKDTHTQPSEEVYRRAEGARARAHKKEKFGFNITKAAVQHESSLV